jgi:hypothetical protein
VPPHTTGARLAQLTVRLCVGPAPNRTSRLNQLSIRVKVAFLSFAPYVATTYGYVARPRVRPPVLSVRFGLNHGTERDEPAAEARATRRCKNLFNFVSACYAELGEAECMLCHAGELGESHFLHSSSSQATYYGPYT